MKDYLTNLLDNAIKDLVKNFDEETLSKKQNIALLKAGLKQTI